MSTKTDEKIEKLKNDFSETEKQLAKQIAKIQETNNLIKNRFVFIQNKEKLQEFLKEIESQEEINLEVKNFKIKLVKGEYRDDDAINISNKLILKEFITFVCGKIDIKIIELEKKIVA